MNRTYYRAASKGVVLAFLTIGSTNIFAAALNLSGGGVVNVANAMGGQVAVTSSPVPCISFAGSTTCTSLATPIVVSGVDPMFGTTGTIKDIGTSFPVTGFKTVNLTVPGGPAIFDLLSIPAPTGFPLCTFATNSGTCSSGTFTLTQFSPTVSTVQITFTTTEIAYTGTSATGSTPYVGIFTTQLSGFLPNNAPVSIGNILAYEAAGGTIKSTWSASESPLPTSRFTGCTVTQGGWGAPAHGNNPGTFLNNNFFPTYGPAGVTIGGLNTLTFTTAANVRAFLPQGGPPSFLNSSALNPTTSSAGVFAGQVLALQLNVDLEGLGSLVLSGTGTSLDGKTVSQVLAAANIALGGGPLPAGFASYSALNDLIDQLNSSFDGCVKDAWATTHLH